VATPAVAAIGFAAQLPAATPPYPTEIMRLAEDGVMFTIARFEKRFCYLQNQGEILRIARRRTRISNPDSKCGPPVPARCRARIRWCAAPAAALFRASPWVCVGAGDDPQSRVTSCRCNVDAAGV
jgi:hypothetical protein